MEFQINIATLVFSDTEGAAGLFAVDQATGKAYRVSVSEADPVESGRIMMAISGEMREGMVGMPNDQISEVMRAERELSEEVARKMAERRSDARGRGN